MEVNIHEAKTHLSRLLQRVAGGEEIIIARSGKPVARLVSITVTPKERPLGMDQGLYRVPADFNAPLPADLLAAFEGSGSAWPASTSDRPKPSKRRRR
jgi:prevent-host-death family protein